MPIHYILAETVVTATKEVILEIEAEDATEARKKIDDLFTQENSEAFFTLIHFAEDTDWDDDGWRFKVISEEEMEKSNVEVVPWPEIIEKEAEHRALSLAIDAEERAAVERVQSLRTGAHDVSTGELPEGET